MMSERFTDLPARIARLPRDKRGFPVPKFVTWIDGEPRFPIADGNYLRRAVARDLCWICGDKLGRHKAFTIGPMCCVNRISAEPPSHYECAAFSVRACPFLSRPLAVRTFDTPGDALPAGMREPPGVMLKHNPGVTALWVTGSYQVKAGLCQMGPAERVEFFALGRRASREEIEAAFATGYGRLEELARAQGPAALAELAEAVRAFWRIVAGAVERASA